ncbi:MAG TPA: sigma-70 family RNA polymerase sigma factor [Planctomycetota bacterium]|jgi:RNA polymerase sigma-70 factor (ECF subfamily)|nr:sigma-70 family RNA polymerase sigma factor [Planctomycetota bacterium]
MPEGARELAETVSLIRRARDGDAAASERLFERYSRVALECARRLTGAALRRKVEAEDLAQSALAEVWRDFRRFDYRGVGSLDRFVRRVVENKIRDKAEYWRAQRRDAGLERSLRRPSSGLSETKGPDFPSEDLTTTQFVSRRETGERVREAIGRLPEEHALPLRLFWIEELPLKDVAAKLSLPSSDAARMRIQRARDALRKLLEVKRGG